MNSPKAIPSRKSRMGFSFVRVKSVNRCLLLGAFGYYTGFRISFQRDSIRYQVES
jgi:hypothetical protein